MTAVRADGSGFPVELANTRITTDGPSSFTGYVRDITERSRAVEKLQANQELLDYPKGAGRYGVRLVHTVSVCCLGI